MGELPPYWLPVLQDGPASSTRRRALSGAVIRRDYLPTLASQPDRGVSIAEGVIDADWDGWMRCPHLVAAPAARGVEFVQVGFGAN
jgi:hypothetical protein